MMFIKELIISILVQITLQVQIKVLGFQGNLGNAGFGQVEMSMFLSILTFLQSGCFTYFVVGVFSQGRDQLMQGIKTRLKKTQGNMNTSSLTVKNS